MKKILYSICTFLFIFLPSRVFAEGYISPSTTSLTIDQGSSKTFTISAYNTIGDVSISSNNSSIASVNVSEWGTGMVDEKQTKTGSITVYGVNVGTTTITLTFDAATFDNDDLSGQTKTISVTVLSSVPTPIPAATPTPDPSDPTPSIPIQQTPKGTDATLKNIKISSGVLNFDANVLSYDVTVGFDVDKIEINGELNDSKASLNVDGDTNLKLGFNTFKIKVTAEDGTTLKEYTINVIRSEKVLSKNSTLKELKISNYNFKFNKNQKNYKLKISNEDSLTIEAVVDDALSKYEIIGNKNLKNGSIIQIKVMAEDGSNTLYKINIVKGEKRNIGLILSLVLNIILILVIAYIWYIGRKNNYNVLKLNKKENKLEEKKIVQNEIIENKESFSNQSNISNNFSNFNPQINNSYFENHDNASNNKNY